MLTIIHGADFHLDAPFAALPPDKARARRAEQRELLDRLAGKEIVMRQLEGYQVILRDSTKWRERSRSIK